jgi:hypothetical protein
MNAERLLSTGPPAPTMFDWRFLNYGKFEFFVLSLKFLIHVSLIWLFRSITIGLLEPTIYVTYWIYVSSFS